VTTDEVVEPDGSGTAKILYCKARKEEKRGLEGGLGYSYIHSTVSASVLLNAYGVAVGRGVFSGF
jgi:hypothetical protein